MTPPTSTISDVLTLAAINATILAIIFVAVLTFAAIIYQQLLVTRTRILDAVAEMDKPPWMAGISPGPPYDGRDPASRRALCRTMRQMLKGWDDAGTSIDPRERGETLRDAMMVVGSRYPFPEYSPEEIVGTPSSPLLLSSVKEVEEWLPHMRDLIDELRPVVWLASRREDLLNAYEAAWRDQRFAELKQGYSDEELSAADLSTFRMSAQDLAARDRQELDQVLSGFLANVQAAAFKVAEIDELKKQRTRYRSLLPLSKTAAYWWLVAGAAAFLCGVALPMLWPAEPRLAVAIPAVSFYAAVFYAVLRGVRKYYEGIRE